MNQEIKTLWLEALRSGDYVQGKGRLRCESDGVVKHCCLGVLGDLFVKTHPDEQWTPHESEGYYALGGHLMVLPLDVMKWAGLEDRNPSIATRGEISNLTAANDIGASFSEIAALIEAQL